MSGCLLNIVLDPVFILPWGLNMGAAGAGCATFLSNCVACLYFFILLFVKRGRTYVCVSPRLFGFHKNILRGICAVGIPAAIQNLLNVTGMTVLNNFTASYGSDAVAAMGISYKIYLVPVQIALGLSQGVMPLVSYNFASGNRKRMKDTIYFTLKLSIISMAVITLIFYTGAGSLVQLFMKNEQIVAYGVRFLRGMSIGQVFLCIDFIGVGVYQACGLGRLSLLFAILRKIVLEIPAILILNALFPLYGMAYSQTVAEIILSVVALLVLRRIVREP
jgi:Na+-driven multidrug efflux pump